MFENSLIRYFWINLDGRGILVFLGRSSFGVFEILKRYGTYWKINFWNLRDLETLWYILEKQYLGVPLKSAEKYSASSGTTHFQDSFWKKTRKPSFSWFSDLADMNMTPQTHYV